MQHLRITVPARLTEPVLAAVADDPAVTTLTVQRGSALRPLGDVIELDVAREATNDVVDALRRLGVPDHGTVHIAAVPTWLSREALTAEQEAPGHSADAVVWAQVAHQSYAETELNWSYGSFMVLATLLAGIAIILDSQILVIGAMVLGPEFAAIAALGVALVRRRYQLLRRATVTLLGGFAVAILATTGATLLGRALGWVTLRDVTGPRPGTGFIYTPDRWSFIVALIAAAAGVLSLTSARVGGLSGVFISVTTIPAAANVGMALAFGVRSEVVGSSLQLALNLVGMAAAGALTLALQQAVWARVLKRRVRARAKHP
ncbi:MAG TPA: DUF389 domain-containing protein [Nocardioides sp.]|uniref:DUF389 domain-containing protein n=1 Tax=Nocardioides sp. TaxID=35761 RepID=UPI002C26FA23|nr:DUF389 domain-containing protein [Nocardioides sp.]HQR27828.1 DUF389 domain-containing protein [Nocardioides sp.]